MNDEDQGTSNAKTETGALAVLLEGGLPQVVAGPAGKAISRLIAAGTDIPAVWIEGISQGIRDKTEARTAVTKAIAEKAAKIAVEDPDVMERAVSNMLATSFRKQENREAVAAAALEDLSSDAPTEAAGEPEDDWFNVFERYAEDASSERLQGLWGKVLAGEIRRPGSFSMRTLRFLSEVSQSDAEAFERLSTIAFADVVPKVLAITSANKNVDELLRLEASGLIQTAGGNGLEKIYTIRDAGYFTIQEGGLAIVFHGEPQKKIKITAFLITSLGQELLSLVSSRNARDAAITVANSIRNAELREAQLGEIDYTQSSLPISITETLWKE